MTPGAMTYQSLREQREKRLKDAEDEARRRRQRIALEPPHVPSMLDFERLDPFSQIAERSDPLDRSILGSLPETIQEDEKPPWGATAFGNAMSDIREGTVKGLPGWLKPVLYVPMQIARGGLVAMEASGNVAEEAASRATWAVQRTLIPGVQEFEQVVQEKRLKGMGFSEAVEDGWNEVSLEAFSVPFFRTFLTPEGSITVDWKDVIEVGFNPIDLAAATLTGGLGAGVKATLAVGVKQGMKAMLTRGTAEGLKVAARQSVLGKAGSALTSQGIRAAVRTAVAETPGWAGPGLLRDATKTGVSIARRAPHYIGDPRTAWARRTVGAAERGETSVARIVPWGPSSEMAESIVDKLGSSTAGQIGQMAEGARKIAGVVPNPVARGIAKVVKAWSPAAVAGEDVAARATAVQRIILAHGNESTNAIKFYAQSFGDMEVLFKVRNTIAEVDNIALTPAGVRGYAQANAKRLAKKLDELPTEPGTFARGDIFERSEFVWDGGDLVRSGKDSWFTGHTTEQAQAIAAFQRIELQFAQEGVRLGIYADIPTARHSLGSLTDAFNYQHRQVLGVTVTDAAGQMDEVLYRGSRGVGPKVGSVTDQLKSRVYEMQVEGVREGVMYDTALASLEAHAHGFYRAASEKAMKEVVERAGATVTDKAALAFYHPETVEGLKNAQAFVASTRANVGRAKRKLARSKTRGTLLKGGDEAAEKEVLRYERALVRADTEEQEMLFKAMRSLEQAASKAPGEVLGDVVRPSRLNKGQRLVAMNRYKAALGALKEKGRNIEQMGKDWDRAFRQAGRAHGRVNVEELGRFGITDDLATAEAEYSLAQLTLKRVRMEHSAALQKSADAKMLDYRLFGEKAIVGSQIGGETGPVLIEHMRSGPFTGQAMPKHMADSLQKAMGDRGTEVMRKVGLVTGSARTLSAGAFDVGWPAIQGSMLAVTHPHLFAKAVKQSFLALKDPAKFTEWMVSNYEDVVRFVEASGNIGSSEFFAAAESMGGLGRLSDAVAKHLPQGERMQQAFRMLDPNRQVISRLGTGFNAFLDVSKVELYKSLRGMVAAGYLTEVELAQHVNAMLGTLDSGMLGVGPTQRQIEGGLLMFSPRYTRSAYALVGSAMQSPAGRGTLQGLASRESLRAMAGMVGAAEMVTWAIGATVGEEPELNPFNPGWLTVGIGGTRVGVGGSTRALLDMFAKGLVTASGVGDRELTDLLRWNLFDPDHRQENPLMSYWLNRTAPGVREALTRETFDGQALDTPSKFLLKGIAPKYMPFALQDYFMQGPGEEKPSALSMIPETLGLRARPLSPWETFKREADRLAMEKYGRPWDEKGGAGLAGDEKADLLASNPELKGKQEMARLRADADLGPYFAKVNEDKEWANGEYKKAAKEFIDGKFVAPITFRKKVDEISWGRAADRMRRDDPEGPFTQALQILEENRAQRADTITGFDLLVDEYIADVKEAPELRDEYGNPVWDLIEQADDAFKARVGDEVYNRIYRHYRGEYPDGTPRGQEEYVGESLVWKLRKDKEIIQESGYWQVVDDIIGPDSESRALWNEYDRIEDPAIKEAMRRRYPRLRRTERLITQARDRMRRRNQALDTALMQWYGLRAKSPQNVRAELVRGRQGVGMLGA